jgi:hypothetical protein
MGARVGLNETPLQVRPLQEALRNAGQASGAFMREGRKWHASRVHNGGGSY